MKENYTKKHLAFCTGLPYSTLETYVHSEAFVSQRGKPFAVGRGKYRPYSNADLLVLKLVGDLHRFGLPVALAAMAVQPLRSFIESPPGKSLGCKKDLEVIPAIARLAVVMEIVGLAEGKLIRLQIGAVDMCFSTFQFDNGSAIYSIRTRDGVEKYLTAANRIVSPAVVLDLQRISESRPTRMVVNLSMMAAELIAAIEADDGTLES